MCCNIWLLTKPKSFAVLWQQSRGEEGKWRNRWKMWKQTCEAWQWQDPGSLLSPPLLQTRNQTPSPIGMVEVPRECWLQAPRKWNRFASSSPVQIEYDVHADKVGWQKIKVNIKADWWLCCQNYETIVVKLTYFTKQSPEVWIVVVLHYFDSQSYLDFKDNKIIIIPNVCQDLNSLVFESQSHLDS